MWSLFETNWSWVGVGGGFVLAVLLFFTNLCRDSLAIPRWKDPVWVSWAIALSYLLHNFEEYGYDLLGQTFHFPLSICQQFGFATLEACPVPLSFFVAVNIPLFWFAFPFAALMAKRNPAVGMAGSAFILVNAITHTAALFTPAGYSSGALTAIILFIPLSIWSFVAFFGRTKLLPWPIFWAVWVGGIAGHLMLFAAVLLFLNGVISADIMIAMQLVNPFFVVGIPWLASRIWHPNWQAAPGRS